MVGLRCTNPTLRAAVQLRFSRERALRFPQARVGNICDEGTGSASDACNDAREHVLTNRALTVQWVHRESRCRVGLRLAARQQIHERPEGTQQNGREEPGPRIAPTRPRVAPDPHHHQGQRNHEIREDLPGAEGLEVRLDDAPVAVLPKRRSGEGAEKGENDRDQDASHGHAPSVETGTLSAGVVVGAITSDVIVRPRDCA